MKSNLLKTAKSKLFCKRIVTILVTRVVRYKAIVSTKPIIARLMKRWVKTDQDVRRLLRMVDLLAMISVTGKYPMAEKTDNGM